MKHLKYFGVGLLALIGFSLFVALFYLASSFLILGVVYLIANLWQALLVVVALWVAYALGKAIMTPPTPATKNKYEESGNWYDKQPDE